MEMEAKVLQVAWSCRAAEPRTGVQILPRKRGSNKHPGLPGGIPKGYFLVEKENWKLSRGL